MLSEEGNRKILREHFVVALEPHGSHSNVGFGIRMWAYEPDGRELTDFWWGTNWGTSPSPQTADKCYPREVERVRKMLEETLAKREKK